MCSLFELPGSLYQTASQAQPAKLVSERNSNYSKVQNMCRGFFADGIEIHTQHKVASIVIVLRNVKLVLPDGSIQQASRTGLAIKIANRLSFAQ